MIRPWKTALSVATLAVLTACGGGDDDPAGTSTGATPTASSVALSQDFNLTVEGWTGESADYTTATAPTDVVFEQRTADKLASSYTAKAFYIAGTNRSDDLLLYVKKQFAGLVANTEYTFTVQSLNFLSNAATGCMGVGGAPGESVYVIAAASTTEPKAVNTNGDVRLNIAHGNQGTPGAASLVLGNIANGLPCDGSGKYAAKLVKNLTGIKVKTDGDGKVWVLVGIDSGYEATSNIYLQSVIFGFVPVTTTT